MSGRLVSLGVVMALLVALAGVIVAACYEVPRPDCGFVCGPDNACPESYTCAGDHRCHRIDAPDTLVCSTPDGSLPGPDASVTDGMADTMTTAVDAMIDAMIDAPGAAM